MKYFLLLLLISFESLAGGLTVTCTPPTLNTDGSTIPATGPDALASFRIEYGTCNGAAFGVAAGSITSATCGASVTGLAPQLWCVRSYSKNNAGNESDPSNVLSKTVLSAKPMPPTGLAVTSMIAYKMRQTVDGFTFVAIGSVAAGTQCSDLSAQGFNVVPRSAVKLTSKFDTLPLIAWAVCS